MNSRYLHAFEAGRPVHQEYDRFWLKHPFMDVSRRAKIFSPFDALKGFDEAVASKRVLYEDQKEQSEEDANEISRRLEILHNLTWNSRMARANRPMVTVTWYIPCRDRNSFAYGTKGQYQTLTGICRKVEEDVLLVEDTRIPVSSIRFLESPLFNEERDPSCW